MCMYICVYIYIYIYVCMYAYVYIYTYREREREREREIMWSQWAAPRRRSSRRRHRGDPAADYGTYVIKLIVVFAVFPRKACADPASRPLDSRARLKVSA